MTSLTVAPSWTLMPKPLFEFRMTQLSKSTWRMSASVSVPIISAVDEDVSTQLVTVTFSVGRAGWPSRPIVFSTIASSPVSMVEFEMATLRDETISIPSAFTPFSRSETMWTPSTRTRSQSFRRTFHNGECTIAMSRSRTFRQLFRMTM